MDRLLQVGSAAVCFLPTSLRIVIIACIVALSCVNSLGQVCCQELALNHIADVAQHSTGTGTHFASMKCG